MTSAITNTSENKILVTEIGLTFDWQIGKGTHWKKDCAIEVSPDEKTVLLKLPFKISIDVSLSTHGYKPGIVFKILEEGRWRDQGYHAVKRGKHVLIKRSPKLDTEVFISHSNHNDDQNITETASHLLRNCGIGTYIAERRPEPGRHLWDKLERKIRNCDYLLVIWTKNAAASGDVREEVGIAVGAHKKRRIFSLAEADLRGSLKGMKYLPLRRKHPESLAEGVESIVNRILNNLKAS